MSPSRWRSYASATGPEGRYIEEVMQKTWERAHGLYGTLQALCEAAGVDEREDAGGPEGLLT